jgi:excinuclease ABC subunit C
MIAEVLARRLQHPEWPYPNLLVIDGGKPQMAAALRVTKEIPIVSLAKRFEEIIVPRANQFQTIRLPLTNPAIHVLQRIRDEAHRFAKSYNLLLRRKLLDTIEIHERNRS